MVVGLGRKFPMAPSLPACEPRCWAWVGALSAALEKPLCPQGPKYSPGPGLLALGD